MNLYEYSVKRADGVEIPLSTYRGKVLLLVNTASQCGFTPQLAELQALYQRWNPKGLVVLAFPCNQFHNQEPEDNPAIQSFCQTRFGVTFPVLAKIEVNGPGAHPLYQYLKAQQPFGGFDMEHPLGPKLDEILSAEDPNYDQGRDIKWNFTKFLINRSGEVVARYEPTTSLEAIEQDIIELL